MVRASASGAPPSRLTSTMRAVQNTISWVSSCRLDSEPSGSVLHRRRCDGACTFRAAIETQIEIDYQLSQAGRGLKYSSDPRC